jgi:hypothetical protein
LLDETSGTDNSDDMTFVETEGLLLLASSLLVGVADGPPLDTAILLEGLNIVNICSDDKGTDTLAGHSIQLTETDISGTNGSAITGKVSGLVDGGLKDRRTELGRKVFVKCT